MKKYIRVFLLCLLMTLMLVPSTAFADTEEKSGTWGVNLTWELDEDGTLTISGTGAMNDFSMDPDANRTAWKQFRLEIKKVVIEDGVTSIGNGAFDKLLELESVTMPESVTSIGDMSFNSCSNLVEINFSNSITSIGEDAFWHCSNLKSVTFLGAAPSSVSAPFDGVTATVYYHECSGTWTERVKESCGGTLTWEDMGHEEIIDTPEVPATCGADGHEAVSHCSVCDKSLSKGKTISATGEHSPEAIVTKATLNADGEIAYKCSTCGVATQDSETIYMPKAFSLSYATTSYNGKAKTPYVTVKDSQGNVLEKDKDYSVAYASGCTKVGIYKVTVKGAGNYSFTKTLTFKINPATPALKKTTVGSKKLTVYMTTKPSSKGASTYQIYYKQKGTSTWKKTTTTAQSKTIKSLKKGKCYYVKVRAYKKVGTTTYYGAWSKTKLSSRIK